MTFVNMNDGLLKGLTVLDLSQNLPGPYCSRILGDMGARIIKIEPPRRGDSARIIPDFFQQLNANKESLSIDLKTVDGLKVIQRFVPRVDVILEGFRPGVAEKLGLGFLQLKELNPKIIYCSISGFGQTGPLRDVPVHDLNLQAMSGFCAFEGIDITKKSSLPIADYAAAMNAVSAIAAAAFKQRSNPQEARPTYLDIAMSEGLAHMVNVWSRTIQDPRKMVQEFNKGVKKKKQLSTSDRFLLGKYGQSFLLFMFKRIFGRGVLSAIPTYDLFKTSDHRLLCLGIVDENHFWKSFCEVMGPPLSRYGKLSLNARVVLSPWLKFLIRRKFKQRPADYWVNLFHFKTQLPLTVVYTPKEVFRSTQFQNRGILARSSQFDYVNSAFVDKAAVQPQECRLGAQGESLLKELGLSTTEIQRLVAADVVWGLKTS